jgi:hypothetical protein
VSGENRGDSSRGKSEPDISTSTLAIALCLTQYLIIVALDVTTAVLNVLQVLLNLKTMNIGLILAFVTTVRVTILNHNVWQLVQQILPYLGTPKEEDAKLICVR